MKNYQQFKNQLLEDEEIKNTYEDLGPTFTLIEMLIQKRLKKGLSQKQIADKISTRQSAISRLESGRYNPSFNFLQKIAKALDARLKVSLVEK